MKVTIICGELKQTLDEVDAMRIIESPSNKKAGWKILIETKKEEPKKEDKEAEVKKK